MHNRVVKNAVKAAGANVTPKHIEDISLSGLFLLEAAKTADEIFQVPPSSNHHTVRDAASDIQSMVESLLKFNVTQEMNRTGSPFRGVSRKVVGGAQAALRDTPLIYRACADQARYLTHNYTHCAVNLGYHQIEFQSFSLYILNKHTAVKTPRALVMGAHAQDSAVFQSALTNAQI